MDPSLSCHVSTLLPRDSMHLILKRGMKGNIMLLWDNSRIVINVFFPFFALFILLLFLLLPYSHLKYYWEGRRDFSNGVRKKGASLGRARTSSSGGILGTTIATAPREEQHSLACSSWSVLFFGPWLSGIRRLYPFLSTTLKVQCDIVKKGLAPRNSTVWASTRTETKTWLCKK